MLTLLTILPALLLTSSPAFVSHTWLRDHAQDANLVILHVAQNRGAYDAGHIPGAVFLAWNEFVFNGPGAATEMPDAAALEKVFERAGVSEGSTVVVYGDPLMAARAFVALEYIGHQGARILDGGLPAWRSAGYPVSRERVRPRTGTLTARPTSFVVTADTVLAMIDRPNIALVDARPEREFTGEDGGMGGMHAAGHIPTARNLYWERLIESRANPLLHDDAELRRLFEGAGAKPGSTVVIYCMIGMRASWAYAVARHLDYDVKFYDGSWVDWSQRKLPVERQ